MKIYKYTLNNTDEQTLELPFGAKILDVQVQNCTVCMWCLVTETNSPNKREFVLYGTGRKIREDMDQLEYVATYQLAQGALVFHLFEKLY